MSKEISGVELGLVLCRMFGIDPKDVLQIVVEASVGAPAYVTVTTRPIISDGWTMERTYQLKGQNEE